MAIFIPLKNFSCSSSQTSLHCEVLKNYIFVIFSILLNSGSKTVCQHRQIVAKDHAESARDHQCGAVLHGRRHLGATFTPSPGATGNVPEILDWVLREKETLVSKVSNLSSVQLTFGPPLDRHFNVDLWLH